MDLSWANGVIMDPRPYLSASDAELVLQARAGDGDAFSALVDRHRPLVVATTRMALRSYDDAEDATQEAFVLASHRLHDLQDPAKFPTWLYSIATNVVRKWLRFRALRDRGLERFAADTGRPQASEKLGGGISQEVLGAAVARLNARDREVITLYYLVGLEQANIAEILRIPKGTVKSRTSHARDRLRKRLQTLSLIDAVPEDHGRTWITGFKGQIPWRKLLGKGLEGWEDAAGQEPDGWERRTNTLIGRAPARPLAAGVETWADFELSLLITPISGGGPQIRFRTSESGQDGYVLEFLMDWGAVAISGARGDTLTRMCVVDVPLERNREYHVMLAAREASITSYVDGALANQVTDFRWRAGALALWIPRGTAAYRDPRVRFMH